MGSLYVLLHYFFKYDKIEPLRLTTITNNNLLIQLIILNISIMMN